MNIIKRLFARRTVHKELVKISQDGCMAHIYTVVDRGHVVKGFTKLGVYNGNPGGCDLAMYLVERTDGSRFDAIVDRCRENLSDDASQRAGEDLTGKIVEFV